LLDPVEKNLSDQSNQKRLHRTAKMFSMKTWEYSPIPDKSVSIDAFSLSLFSLIMVNNDNAYSIGFDCINELILKKKVLKLDEISDIDLKNRSNRL
jgi:hypothetical protein